MTVSPVNDAPQIHIPPDQEIPQGVQLILGIGNEISVSDIDVDPSAGNVFVELSSTHGTMTLNSTNGLSMTVGDGVQDSIIKFTGTIDHVNAALNGMKFDPDVQFAGDANIAININDLANGGSGGALTAAGNIKVSVHEPAHPPTAENLAMTAAEDTPRTITLKGHDAGKPGVGEVSFQIADADPGKSGIQTINGGTLVSAGPIITDNNGNYSQQFNYAPALNYYNYVNGIQVSSSDSFSYSFIAPGAGGNETSPAGTGLISVTAVNDAPIVSAPTSASTFKATGLVFSAGLISVSDVDAGSGLEQITITAPNAKAYLSDTSGLTFMSGTTNGSSSIVVKGTIDKLNNGLSGLTFTPNDNFTGSTYLKLTVSDLGNTGSGGYLSATRTINVNVAPKIYWDGNLSWKEDSLGGLVTKWYYSEGQSNWAWKIYDGTMRYQSGGSNQISFWNGSGWDSRTGALYLKDAGYSSLPEHQSNEFRVDLHDGIGYDGEPVTIHTENYVYQGDSSWAQYFTVKSKNATHCWVTGNWTNKTLMEWYVEDKTAAASLDVYFVMNDPDDTTGQWNFVEPYIRKVQPMNNLGQNSPYVRDWNASSWDNMVRDDVRVVFFDPFNFNLNSFVYETQLISYADGVFGQQTPIRTLSVTQHGNTGEFFVGTDCIWDQSYDTTLTSTDGHTWNTLSAANDPTVRSAFSELKEVMTSSSQIQMWECWIAGKHNAPDSQAVTMLQQLAGYSGATIFASTDLTALETIWNLNWSTAVAFSEDSADWTLEYATNGNSSSIILPWNVAAMNSTWRSK